MVSDGFYCSAIGSVHLNTLMFDETEEKVINYYSVGLENFYFYPITLRVTTGRRLRLLPLSKIFIFYGNSHFFPFYVFHHHQLGLQRVAFCWSVGALKGLQMKGSKRVEFYRKLRLLRSSMFNLCYTDFRYCPYLVSTH